MQFPYQLIELLSCIASVIFYLYAMHIFHRPIQIKSQSFFGLVWIASVLFLWAGCLLLPGSGVYPFEVVCLVVFSIVLGDRRFPQCLLVPLLYSIFDLMTSVFIFYMLQNMLHLNIVSDPSSRHLARIFCIFMIYLLQAFLLYLVGMVLPSSEQTIVSSSVLLFFFSDFCIVLLCHILFFYLLPDNSNVGLFLVLVCIIMLFSTFFVLFHMTERTQEQLWERETDHLKTLLEQQHKQMIQLHQEREKTAVLRHDMKHYLTIYLAALENGDIPSVEEDIRQMLGQRLSFSTPTFTDNPTLNSLLLFLKEQCEDRQISFRAQAIIPSSYHDIDILTTLLNLVDNAIDAEQKLPQEDRLISVSVSCDTNTLSILVRNRITESILEKNPTLKTSKPNLSLHGYGLRSVAHIAEIHGGIIDIFEEKDMFCVHVFFPGILREAALAQQKK